ncbi:MAG TPA: beta-propeller fold lactonase family protein [Isosphaeraceae bacterium]|jgi:DNA-binding beta-propeller fold protein YncE
MIRTGRPGRTVTRPGTGGTLLGVCLLFLTAIALPARPARAQAPAGTVYVMSNVGHVAGANSILGFRRDAAGRLTLFGEFATRGTGTHPTPNLDVPESLGTFDVDQPLIINRAGTRLFAVNSGSDTIAVFNVRRNGALAHVAGSPFPSGGGQPVSVGLAANETILAVANKDYDLGRSGFNPALRRPNYTTLRVTPQGRLLPIPRATIVADPDGGFGPGSPNPTQMLVAHDVARQGRRVNPSGRLVFDVDFFGLMIHSFALRPNGRLVPVQSQMLPSSESPVPGINSFGLPIPLGQQVHPTQPVLYLGQVLDQKLAVYTYDAAGRFQFVRSLPGAGDGICWFVTNAAGTRLYSANNFDNSVAVFDISDAQNPVKLQNFSLADPDGLAFQIAIDPAGQFLHVISQRGADSQPAEANALHVLQLGGDGRVTAQTDRITLPIAPSRSQGVVAR